MKIGGVRVRHVGPGEAVGAVRPVRAMEVPVQGEEGRPRQAARCGPCISITQTLSLPFCVSLFCAAAFFDPKTLVGPLYLGAINDQTGRTSAYLVLGRIP